MTRKENSTALQTVIDNFKTLVAQADAREESYVPGTETKGEATHRTLTSDQRDTAMLALKGAGYNWFRAQEMYKSDPQILLDIRSLEMEITEKLTQAIVSGFDNVSEAGAVAVLNDSYGMIFDGMPPGIVFDTNFYTCHSILKHGVEITDKTLISKLKTKNQIQALMKMASHMDRTEFLACATQENIKDYREALNAVDAHNVVILSKKEAVSKSLAAQAKALAEQIALETDPTSLRQLSAQLARVKGILADDAQLEMVAKNQVYEELSKETQSKFDLLGKIEAEAKTLIARSGITDETLKAGLMKNFKRGDFSALSSEDTTTLTLKRNLQELYRRFETTLLDAVVAQMDALPFANEPYFSQATITGVVAGIQMAKVHENPEKMEELVENYPILKEPQTWLNNAMENFGDLMKEWNHSRNDKPESFLYKGAKYLFRMAFAAQNALKFSGSGDSSLIGKVAELTEMAAKLQDIRSARMDSGKKLEASLEITRRGSTDLLTHAKSLMLQCQAAFFV